MDYVADHAVRATSSFPVAEGTYYGIDYGDRAGANDLSWYKNIPVPTSYMVCQTNYDFFGGYDYAANGGFVCVANRHVAPGKKQWTWGNSDFGIAWDRELTDENGPYIELMAGAYTDNQPDFTYLQPYETKTFSQFWWAYQDLGPVQNANESIALRLVVGADGAIDMGVAVTDKLEAVSILLTDNGREIFAETVAIAPDAPWQHRGLVFRGETPSQLQLTVNDELSYSPVVIDHDAPQREPATEPPLPEDIETLEELFLTAEHLEQYRHPTRYPEAYWQEALRRDPADIRCHLAYGRYRLGQGLLSEAEQHFAQAMQRLTNRHPNPCSGEAHYYWGLVRRMQGDVDGAYGAFYKATWDYAWRSAAYYQVALIDALRGDYLRAIEHCEASLDTNRLHNKAIILKSLASQKIGHPCTEELQALLQRDPLDHWARWVAGERQLFAEQSRNDAQTILDVAYDFIEAGCHAEAIELLQWHHAQPVAAVPVPNPLERSALTQYVLAWLQQDQDVLTAARVVYRLIIYSHRVCRICRCCSGL